METEQFDRLAKALSSSTHRRHLVTGLGASIVAVLFGTEASAAKQKHHKAKKAHHRKHRGDRKGTNQKGKTQQGTERQVTASGKKCRKAGHPCAGKQAGRCCEGLACRKSGRGAAR